MKQNDLNMELKEMQFKLAESCRHRDRALADVTRMETKLLEVSSGHGELLGDTKKQLWEVEDKVCSLLFDWLAPLFFSVTHITPFLCAMYIFLS